MAFAQLETGSDHELWAPGLAEDRHAPFKERVLLPSGRLSVPQIKGRIVGFKTKGEGKNKRSERD